MIPSQFKMLALNRINESRLIPNGLGPVKPVTHMSEPALKMRAPRFPTRITVARVVVFFGLSVIIAEPSSVGCAVGKSESASPE